MARTYFNRLRLDRTVLETASFAKAEKLDNAAFRRMTPRQRLEMVETLRQMNHAHYDPDTTLLPRIYTITQRASR